MKRWIVWALIALGAMLPPAAQAQTDRPCSSFAPPGQDATYYLGLGHVYSLQGDTTNAILVYNCAVAQQPDYAPLYINRGLANAAQANDTAALADYNRALELDPNSTAALLNRGVLYSRQANYALAIADFTALTTAAPDFAPAYLNRGLVHAAEQNYDEAIADIEQALELDANSAEAHRALGTIYAAKAIGQIQQYAALSGIAAQYAVPDAFGPSLQAFVDSGDPSVWSNLQTTAQGD